MGSYALKENNKRVKLGTRLQVASDPIGAVTGTSPGVRILADRISAQCMQKNVQNISEPLEALFALFDYLEDAAKQNRALLVFQILVNLVKEPQRTGKDYILSIDYLFEYLLKDKFFQTPQRAVYLTDESVMHNLHQCKKIIANLHLNRRSTWWENEAGLNTKMGAIVRNLLLCEDKLIQWRLGATVSHILSVLPEEVELHIKSFLVKDATKFNPSIPLFELNGGGYPYGITSENLTHGPGLNPLNYWLTRWIDEYDLPRPSGRHSSVRLSELNLGSSRYHRADKFEYVGSGVSSYEFVRRSSNIVRRRDSDVYEIPFRF